MNNITLRSTLITFTSFIFVITAVNAWTGPSVPAPDGNVSAPLTISATSQSKTGGLDVGWLSAVGAVKVGYTTTACSAGIAGSLRWNTGVMEYCDGIDTWRSFGGSSTGGGSDSLYCKFTGKSASVSFSGTTNSFSMQSDCSISVDSTGYETITASTRPGNFGSCSESATQSDTVSCTSNSSVPIGDGWSMSTVGRTTASFDRTTGVLTCTAYAGVDAPNPSLLGSNSTTITPDPSLCSAGGGSVAETDPTVLSSVKDGVSWSEVTGKPAELDPTVPANIKDGIDWSEVTNKPADSSPSGTICGMYSNLNSSASALCKGYDPYRNGCPSGYSVVTTNLTQGMDVLSITYCVKQ